MERTGGLLFKNIARTTSDGRVQRLECHLKAVAGAASRSAAKIGAAKAGELLGLLHDFGKYSADFQTYIRRKTPDQDAEDQALGRGKVDHSTAGAQQVWRSLRGEGVTQGIAGEILALCLASHHSGLMDCVSPSGEEQLFRRIEKPDADSHLTEAWAAADVSVAAGVRDLLNDSETWEGVIDVLRGICRPGTSDIVRRFHAGMLARFLFSCLVDADHTDAAGFIKPREAALRQHGRYETWHVLSERLERGLAQFTRTRPVDRLRKRVSEDCRDAATRPPGIYTLTVPTGGGKTLASLRFALHHAARFRMERVVYVGPYTSIIDQNAQVAREILEPAGCEFGSIVLEHHSNLAPREETERSKVLSENWDAPVVFTTAVQFLEALFGAGTRSVRRMHQLARAVLIFDEVQTLPVRCVHLFNNAVNFLVQQCGSTALLCTATQPLLHKVDAGNGAIALEDNPELVADAPSLFNTLKRQKFVVRRKQGGWAHQEVAELAAVEANRTGSCLIVVNTKSQARSIYSECCAVAPDLNVFHLSTSMCPVHRVETLASIQANLDKGTPTLCVSTQLIEAGVDVSFGAVIRAMAGLDSIVQAAGRCNRHGERDVGPVHVVNLVGDTLTTLPDLRCGRDAAERVLRESCEAAKARVTDFDLSRLDLVERYFVYYFFERRREMAYPVGPGLAERDDTLLNLLSENKMAVNACAKRLPRLMRQAFRTAAEAFEPIGTSARGVIVPYGSEGRRLIAEICAVSGTPAMNFPVRRAQRFTVNVLPGVLKRLDAAGALYVAPVATGILCLGEKYYSEKVGLCVEGSVEMEESYA